MTRETILISIEELFRDLLDNNDIIVTEKTSKETSDGWDSLFHMTLMASLADEFSITFSTDEIVNSKDVATIIGLILEKAQ